MLIEVNDLAHIGEAIIGEDALANLPILPAQSTVNEEGVNKSPEAKTAKREGHTQGVYSVAEVVPMPAKCSQEQPEEPHRSSLLLLVLVLKLSSLEGEFALMGLFWGQLSVWLPWLR